MILGPEPVLTAVLARLVAELPGQIDTVNQAVTDGYTLTVPDPALMFDYIPAPGELVDAPAVGIDEGRLTWEDDSGWEATGVLDLLVVAYVQNPEPRGLARVNRRMRLAIMRAILEGSTVQERRRIDPAWGITFRGSEPGPALSGSPLRTADAPPETYLTWTTLAFRCKYDEAI